MNNDRVVPLAELLSGLQAIPEVEFTNLSVARFLSGKLVEMDTLARYVHFDPRSYTRNLIFKNDLFEMLLLCWESGHAAPIHNHSGQHCWMSVQDGMLSVTNYRETPLFGSPDGEPSKLRRVALEEVSRTARAGAGSLEHVDELTYIHKIENLASFGSRTLSLHVYSRPFDRCDVYDLDGQTAQPIQLSYYSMYGKPVPQAC